MAQKIVTPVGELAWVFITGQGKKDLNGNDRFTASLRLADDSKTLKTITAEIKAYWDENKPKGKVRFKSNGIREEQDKNGEATGFHLVNFWTGTSFPDGSAKVVKTYNAKGAEVALGGKKIGNGSRGAISGAMDIYQNGPNVGVTLYLNAIQLTKFIEFSSNTGFEAVDGWTGDDLNADNISAVTDTDTDPSSAGPAKVKL